jgi:hypothetical protein
MQDGTVYTSAHSVSEMLDMIIARNARTLKNEVIAFCNAHELRTTYHHISDLLSVMEDDHAKSA